MAYPRNLILVGFKMKMIFSLVVACFVSSALSAAQSSSRWSKMDDVNKGENKGPSLEHLLLPPPNSFTAGKVKEHAVDFDNTQTFYVIGDDPQSLAWMTSNSAYLREKHAIGIIAQASSIDDILSLDQRFHVRLYPINIEGWQTVLGVKHYPFFVYHGRVEQ
jgi:integrating conjugative element protein (TIGR03765 family)